MRILRITMASVLSVALCTAAQAQQERESRRQQPQQQELQQQELQQQQRPERGGAATASNPELERLWDQMAMLHNRIVEIEVEQHEQEGGATRPATEGTRGSQQELRQQRLRQQGDSRQYGARQGRNQERGATERSTDQQKQLWTQLASVHQQLVAAHLSESGSAGPSERGLQTDTTRESRRSATERDQADENESAQRQDTSRLGQISGTSRGMQEQLWQRFTALQKQILEHDVRQAKMSPEERQADASARPGTRPEFDNEPEQRDQ